MIATTFFPKKRPVWRVSQHPLLWFRLEKHDPFYPVSEVFFFESIEFLNGAKFDRRPFFAQILVSMVIFLGGWYTFL